jgi:hypothetical protein
MNCGHGWDYEAEEGDGFVGWAAYEMKDKESG